MLVRYLLLINSFLLFRNVSYATCPAPNSLYVQNTTHQSATVSWYFYGSNSPSFEVQWRQVGASSWTKNPVTTTYVSSMTGLTNNTSHEWRVRAICAAGDTSIFINGAIFQTACVAPSYTDVTMITHQSAQLVWGQTDSEATYEVQWRFAGASNWTIVSGLTTNFLNLSGLSEDTSFEWKVRRMCSSTATSDFSIGPYFRTRCLAPSNPRTTLTSPSAVELKWDSPVANGRFDLQWRAAGQSTWTVVEGIQASEYVLTGLANATTYEWQVRTACSATSKSAFTDINVFQTRCPLPTNLINTSVRYNTSLLQWTSPASDLQWRPVGAAEWNFAPGARPPYTLTGLTNNTVYEWRVRTVCSPAGASDYTTTQLLTTRCSAPAGTYGSTVGSRTIQINWDYSEGNLYELQWRKAGTTNWSVASALSSSPYSLTGLAPETTYEWRIRSQCSATDYSDFVEGQSMTANCSSPYYLQYANSTYTSIDLIWTAMDLGVKYEVQWRIANAVNWSSIADLTANRYTLTGLLSNTPYEWRVRTMCSEALTSNFSPNQSFTLYCNQPNTFYTSSIDASSARLSWDGGYSLPSYTIQYRKAGAASWISVENLTTNSYLLNGLTNNTNYQWRVRTNCAPNDTTTFREIQTFYTQCGPRPENLFVASTDFNSAVLSWQNAGNTKRYEIQYQVTGSTDWTILQPEGTETDPYFGGNYAISEKKYSLYSLIPGKTYQWRIRIICSSSIYSDFFNGPTFTTACSIPQFAYSRQETNTSLTVGWYTAGLLASCDLQWRKVGSQLWNIVSGLTGNSYKLTNLDAGGSYEYRIRRVCTNDIVGDFSTPATTTLSCLNPYLGRAQLLSATSVKLVWLYANQAVLTEVPTHDLQYRLSGTSDWTTVTGIIGDSYSLTGLTSGNIYDWRVRASCSQGVVSDFSFYNTFQLNCPTPYYYNYDMQVGSTFARLTWIEYSGFAQSYVFQWRVAGATDWSTVIVPDLTSSITYSLTGLTNNTTYEWRVGTNCIGTYSSAFAPIQSFKTACASIQSLNVSNITKNSAQLSWNEGYLPPGMTYTVQYRIKGTVEWVALVGITTTNTSITGLLANTTYEWRVRTACEPGLLPLTSSLFTTQCPNPTNPHTEAVKAESATISWTKQADNLFVNLQWRPYNSAQAWNTVEGITESMYSLTGLTPSTYYEYRLQGVCSTDKKEPYTMSSNNFLTQYSDIGIAVDSITADAARLNWVSGSDRTNYILEWRVTNGTWNTTGPLSTKRYLLTGLLNNTSYEVRLSYVGENNRTYQTTATFTTSCIQPYSLSIVDTRASSARLIWNSNRLPVSVQWRVAGTNAWNSVTGITENTYSLTGLTTATIYEWRLVTQCSSNETNVTFPNVFRTICPMPDGLSTDNISTQSARLLWSNAGSLYSLKYRVVGTNDWTILTGLTSSTYILTNLTDNTTYEWAVATSCEANQITAYTSPVSFKTGCNSAQNFGVVTLAPDGLKFAWDGSGPTYQFQWRLAGSSQWNDLPAVTSPYTLTGLSPNTKYEYRLRAACAVDADGPFVTGSYFTSSCPYSEYSKITTSITSGNAQLTWQAFFLSGVTMRWRAMGSNTWTVIANVTSPYTLTGLTNNTTYEWQLQTACQPNYGSSATFQTQCSSPITLKTEALTATSVMLKWNPAGENVSYKIRWRRVGTTTWNIIPAIVETSYSLTGLANNTSYEWQVASQCSEDETNYQITASFKTSNDCPSGMYTLRNGSWDDPTVWSCNRVPTTGDQVQLKHSLTVPNGYVARH